MRTALAIIIGRAGSKGVPRKNMLPVAGKPCAQWTIEAAMAAACVQDVCVSSDDTELLALGARLGAQAILRPEELAHDRATVDSAARHAVEAMTRRDQRWRRPDAPVVLLYANVPVRPTGLIDRAIEMLRSTGADSVQSYAAVGKMHPWWTARVDEQSGSVRPWEGEVLNHGVFRRQDLPPAHVPDGGVIALTRRALMLEVPGAAEGPHAFFGVDRRGVVTGEGEVVDIDSKVDLLVADALLRGSGA